MAKGKRDGPMANGPWANGTRPKHSLDLFSSEAACRPASGSLIAEMFNPETRGVANGIFSWGVYIGYGLTFTIGNYFGFTTMFGFDGWRVAFVVGCAPGIFIAFLLFFAKDPRNRSKPVEGEVKKTAQSDIVLEKKKNRKRSLVIREEKSYFKTVLYSLLQPAMVLLFVATSIRHTGKRS